MVCTSEPELICFGHHDAAMLQLYRRSGEGVEEPTYVLLIPDMSSNYVASPLWRAR